MHVLLYVYSAFVLGANQRSLLGHSSNLTSGKNELVQLYGRGQPHTNKAVRAVHVVRVYTTTATAQMCPFQNRSRFRRSMTYYAIW